MQSGKKVPDQILVCELGTSESPVWKVPNWSYLDDQATQLDSSKISLESLRSFRCPLFHKPVTDQVLFFATWYKKPALEPNHKGDFKVL